MKTNLGRAALFLGLAASASTVLAGCQKQRLEEAGPSDKNVVRAGDLNTDRTIGDADLRLAVLGLNTFDRGLADAKIVRAGTPAARAALAGLAAGSLPAATADVDGDAADPAPPTRDPQSLLLGLPIGLVGEQSLFGGVVTKVSDKASETLGRLKLMDLTPLHVRTAIANAQTNEPMLALFGCVSNCTESSKQQGLVGIPIVGVDTAKSLLVLDLASLGDELNLIQMLDPSGGYTKLKTKLSKVAGFDFSGSTLIFDVETHMVPIDAKTDDAPITVFTTRWYLKLNSASNPAFTARAPTEGVGFFTTERAAETKISRFSTTNFGGSTVKYFIKNVPAEFQPAFARAMDSWNDQFQAIIGRKLLSYEFIDASDKRAALLVPGDIRFNIIEWDLENLAPYGGLGPSVANQFTGETLSANILVQGPTIVKLYSEWFKLSQQAQQLRESGRDEEAEELLRDFLRETDALQARRTAVSYKLSLGALPFNQKTHSEALEDPLFQRNDFEIIPAGYTYELYMDGYFHELVAHEMGHNVGLRHNFRGNLGATSEQEIGKVSRSVMEYLGRAYRHADRIGVYDTMALSYGYAGKKPEHLDWFCTDENVISSTDVENSAECSRDDATNDPFGFFEMRLTRSIDLLLAPNRKSAPTWVVTDMARELSIATNGLLYYATTTADGAKKLLNFFGKVGRPADGAGVKAFALASLEQQVCDPALDRAIAQKDTEEARTKTAANLTALRARVKELKNAIAPLQKETLRCL